MNYEIGDKVDYRNLIFIMKAEIIGIDEGSDYKYYIEYEDYEDEKHDVWVREEDLAGFSKGSKKHLSQELNNLLETYSKEDILNALDIK